MTSAVSAANARRLDQYFQAATDDIDRIALLNQYGQAQNLECHVTGHQSVSCTLG